MSVVRGEQLYVKHMFGWWHASRAKQRPRFQPALSWVAHEFPPPHFKIPPRFILERIRVYGLSARRGLHAPSAAFARQVKTLRYYRVSCTSPSDVENWGHFFLASQLALQLFVETEDGPFTIAVYIASACTAGETHLRSVIQSSGWACARGWLAWWDCGLFQRDDIASATTSSVRDGTRGVGDGRKRFNQVVGHAWMLGLMELIYSEGLTCYFETLEKWNKDILRQR